MTSVGAGDKRRMLSVEDALKHILSLMHPLNLEQIPILDALDRVLGEDIFAEHDIPPFANSAMDGYAVRSVDTPEAAPEHPVSLRVIGEVAAGYVADLVVKPGTALRIMTGAPMPDGADAVVRFEDTDEARRGSENDKVRRERTHVAVLRPAFDGLNVRLAGEDVKAAERVLASGTIIRPSEIGLLASVGRSSVHVFRRPKVAVLATGDELLNINEPMKPGKIRNSNEYSNAALVVRYGGIPIRLGIARDNPDDLMGKLRTGITQGADLFITSAGVSLGDYDIVKDVLNRMGQMEFWQVRMKPGKPLAFGLIAGIPLIGLPGNPVSSMVSFEQFVRPAMRVMQGQRALRKQTVMAIVEEEIRNDSGRRHYIRAIVRARDGIFSAKTTGEQGSGILTSMVRANALLVIPEDVTLVRAGERCVAQMLDWPEVE